MTVSIIIAVKTWQKNLEECISKCRQLDFGDFEILILPDSVIAADNFPSGIIPANVKIIPTGPVSPALKRDAALKHASGKILAFLDDDAYPQSNWLKEAMKNFQDESVAAVGGPATTPSEDSWLKKASGKVYSSYLVSAKAASRYIPMNRCLVDDYPSCNFFVRKSVMEELSGFNTNFWPGEDTKLCRDITSLKKKIIYDPKVAVFHHRRPLFLPHLKQIASYALHRGYFVKAYPETSLRFLYFVPSLFVLAAIFGAVLSLFLPFFKALYFFCAVIYLLLVLIFSISKELRLIPAVFFGIIFTHFTYGIWFLKGLLSSKLKEER